MFHLILIEGEGGASENERESRKRTGITEQHNQ